MSLSDDILKAGDQDLKIMVNLKTSKVQAMTDDLFSVVRDGTVKISIDQRFALADARAAHEALEGRKTTGSTILMP